MALDGDHNQVGFHVSALCFFIQKAVLNILDGRKVKAAIPPPKDLTSGIVFVVMDLLATTATAVCILGCYWSLATGMLKC